MSELKRLSGIKGSHTTPYHPMCNGKAERFNRTILGMLRTLPDTSKSHWKDHLQKMVHADNATICRSTHFSPFFLMFGREPQLPIDLMFGGVSPDRKHRKSWSTYIRDWKKGMEDAYKVAAEVSKKVGATNKEAYDNKATAAVLDVGTRVLVRNLREKGGPGKLRAYWENKVYRVVERRGDGPVYVVQPEKGGEVRVLHRNHLLPVGERLRELEEDLPKPKPKRPSRQEVVEREDDTDTGSSEVSEEERVQRQDVRQKRQSKKPDRLRYDRLGSPGVDRSKDRVLGCIVQLLEQQQVLVSMLSSVFGQFQRLQTPGQTTSSDDDSTSASLTSHQE